jgi:branched-chain amino acid transport system substrate-binding protein
MNIYRKFENTLVLFLVVFIICLLKMALAAENPALLAPTEATPSTAITPQVTPAKIISPSGKLNRNTIGCVLPLSGQYADWGKKALDAIKLSAEISGKEKQIKWEIIAEDSQGLPDKTKLAVENLANVKNVMAIIAVSEKENALETAREANKLKIPIIVITSKEGVTSAGEYVFQHFLTHTQEIRALVQYAFNYLNCAIFSVLYPQDEYGDEMLKIFSKEVRNNGGKGEKAISYSANQTDFSGEIGKLTGCVVKSPSKAMTRKDDEQEKAPVDFEALFIPDSYSPAKMITSQLDFYNVKGFVIIGTSLWNTPNLLKNGSEYLDGVVFTDSFYKDGFYPETYNFVDSYLAVYQREPENIEALAFDTAGMIFAVLENKSIKTRQELAIGLTKMRIYNGATGATYFDSDRVAQKTPFILRVKKEKIEQIK